MNPQIDFYILQESSALKSLHFACTLIESAHGQSRRVFVNTSSQEEAERLDALLWTFEDSSFIPHQVGPGKAPVAIGYNIDPTGDPQVLINFSHQVPAFYHRFEQVIEIVFSDPVVQQFARERYKQYRDQGLTINTHKS